MTKKLSKEKNDQRLEEDDQTLEKDVQRYEYEQRLCDIANMILKILAEQQTSIWETRWILTNVEQAVDSSIQHASWNKPFACLSVPNRAYTWFSRDEVIAELNRRAVEHERNKQKEKEIGMRLKPTLEEVEEIANKICEAEKRKRKGEPCCHKRRGMKRKQIN